MQEHGDPSLVVAISPSADGELVRLASSASSSASQELEVESAPLNSSGSGLRKLSKSGFERKTRTASLTVPSTSGPLTVDIEELVAEMASPSTGVTIKDRKWRLKTYPKCFVGSEAVDWLMEKLKLSDRVDAVSVGQEIMRLQFFRHVCDDSRQFEDAYLFYSFVGGIRLESQQGGIRSMEELVALLKQPGTGVAIADRRWHFRTYHNCLVGTELVDWMMTNLPLRSRKEAVQLGNRLLQEGYLEHVVDKGKKFKDQYLFYQFTDLSNAPALASSAEEEKAMGLQDFELLKVLGVGAFGKVILVRRRKTGQIYAMKTLHKAEVASSERSIRNLKAEKNILCNDHPFLVHLHYSFQTEDKLYLVMDYIGGGDLFFHLRQRGKFTEREAQFFAAEIVLALEYLHSYGVIYRDLKPENVLFDKDGHVCLTDFGISKEIGEDKTKTLCGTPSYLAPEILKGEAYGESVDWWSLGVLINEMVTGKNPFRSKNIHQTMQWILHKPLVFPEGLSNITTDFITRLLNRDPRQRLGCGITGAREVKFHPFLKQTNWADLAVKRIKSPLRITLSDETDTSYFSSEFTRMSLLEELAPPVSAEKSEDSRFTDWAHSRIDLL
jgi:serine/threonine protein kinase